ncbi:Uncharacterized protein TCAP_00269 [Tolypocladium capitatum]|uniref:Membrane anchor Opy2 N-terminal domain-containing protein n=1 Tax=Tolypocladium capitatum TaxID=45235 RepID=A0A2K3QQM5_9HYPO|nr:Uncharacterized protein TCAP_00269 [Tolypocladium capitatum]
MDGQAPPFAFAKDLSELHEALKLVPQKRGCVQCDSNSRLECPKCDDGQVCQYTIPVDCTQCPKSVCLTDSAPTPKNGSGSGDNNGPNPGPIVGGVLGGIVIIAALTYLVWRFLIRPKRSRLSQSIFEPVAGNARDVEKDNASRMTHRSSTHTVHSIASTVLTRASNIIQIAYIPGVTNRATPTSPTSPTVLVPPVPPIPMHHSEGNRQSNLDDQHFFVPGNLRDSTYSGISAYTDRTSYAPRSSIASTIYGKQAQVQITAQTGMRAKPTVVSVKSGNTSGAITPPVPGINFEKFGAGRPKSSVSAFSVGSTLVNNANTATQGRAQVVKLGGGPRKVDVGAKPEGSTSSGLSSSVSYSDSASHTPTLDVDDSSMGGDLGPFSDPPATPKPSGIPTLGSVIEDEGEDHRGGSKASRRPGSNERGRSPFGDEHATKE